MARKTAEELRAGTVKRRGQRIVMNRAALTEIEYGMAQGLEELGIVMLADATAVMVPGYLDAPPYGEGLVASGFVREWVRKRLVTGRTDIMASANRPHGLVLGADEAVMIVGFASPLAHLQELGTVHQPAYPFLSPAVAKNIEALQRYVLKGIAARVAKATP